MKDSGWRSIFGKGGGRINAEEFIMQSQSILVSGNGFRVSPVVRLFMLNTLCLQFELLGLSNWGRLVFHLRSS